MAGHSLNATLLLAQSSLPGDETLKGLFQEVTAGKVFRLILAILITYVSFVIIRSITTAISERVPRRFRLLIKQSIPILKGLVLVATLSYGLNSLLNLTGSNLIALTGTIAVALGFAFKDYVSSIIAGIVTLFEGPFRMGDRIQIGDYYGEVVDYGLRGLRLQTPDDSVVTIPHNTAWTDAISNANSGQLEAQVVTDFYFAHNADIDLAIDLLYQAAYSSRYTQLKLPVVVLVLEKPWATHLKLKAYPMDARDEFVYKTDLTRRIKNACTRHNLQYPQVSALQESDANSLAMNTPDKAGKSVLG
ncbi:MAG: mechanosensitive ion channel domain-containing protein [Cyanobacteria bacterium J06638_28]